MNTGKNKKILLGLLIILIFLLGIFLWKDQKTKNIVVSVVIPKTVEEDREEWIRGIKACSRDLDFTVDFFFEENEAEAQRKAEEEKKEQVSLVLTSDHLKETTNDDFLDGYRTAEALVKDAKPVKNTENDNEIKVGLSIYNGNDSFIQSLTEHIYQELEKFEKETGVRILTATEDAGEDPQTQDEQLDYLLQQGCDILVVNPVDTWNASRMINKAKKENVPLIFFNREPSDEDIALWNKVFYIGNDGNEIGKMQGELLVEAFQSEDLYADRNKDGIIQYILVEGEEGHIDSVRRNDAMQLQAKTVFPMEETASVPADWNRQTAEHKIETLNRDLLTGCEAIVCNNDDMALGVIDALKQLQITDYPVILGINGSEEAVSQIDKGTLYGTVSQKVQEQAKKIVELIRDFHQGTVSENVQKIYISGEKLRKTTK